MTTDTATDIQAHETSALDNPHTPAHDEAPTYTLTGGAREIAAQAIEQMSHAELMQLVGVASQEIAREMAARGHL